MEKRGAGERGYVLLLVPVVLLGIITLAYTSLRKSKMSLRIAGGELNYLQTELCSQQCASLAVNAATKALNANAQLSTRSEACQCGGLSCTNTFSNPVHANSANCYGHVTATTQVDVASTCKEGSRELSKLSENVNYQEIPLFQFAVFFERDLEIHPGPPMHIRGAVHSNDTIRLFPQGGLFLHNWITSPRAIEIKRHEEAAADAGVSFAKVAGGLGATVQSGSGKLRPLHHAIPSWPAFQQDHKVAYVDKAGKCGKVERLQLNVQDLSEPRALIDWRGANDAADLRRSKFAWNANLIYKDGWKNNNLATTWLDNPVRLPPSVNADIGRVSFWDTREEITVKLIPIDVMKLQQRPGDSIIYLYDTRIDPQQGGRDVGGFLLFNGRSLKRRLTIASNSRIYVHGNFNADSAYVLADGTRKPFPAAIVCDLYTQLSNEWRGIDPPFGKGTSIAVKNPFARTVMNACLMTGMVGYKGSWTEQGGYHNVIRLVEDWWNVPFEFSGSTVCMWDSRLSQARYVFEGYHPPDRLWTYEQMYRDLKNLPPGTPRLVSPQLNTWEMSRQ